MHFSVDTLQLELLLRLTLAVVLGGAIGLERELKGKTAGLRTNILICVGAAMFTQMSIQIPGANAIMYHTGDVSRIASNIVTGVGFLGGGAIMVAKGQVRGMTTAATIWVVAAIGVAAGAGAYVFAVGSTVLVLLVLVPLRAVEDRQRSRRKRHMSVIGRRPEDSFVSAD